MQKLQKSLKSLSNLALNPSGYSIVKSHSLTDLSAKVVKNHISSTLKRKFPNLDEAAAFILANCFDKFKDKPSRMLPPEYVKMILTELKNLEFIHPNQGEFITDEENVGYPNVYWRIVRPNQASDVGPVHADKWFWELGEASLPSGFGRTKIWTPLIQDDAIPSLLILPGSQSTRYNYRFKVDHYGKKKPIFDDAAIVPKLIPAPVSVGESIVFNDSLLHGGRSTHTLRVSIEMTLAHLVPAVRGYNK